MAKHVAWRAAVAVVLGLPLAACGPQPGAQTGGTGATPGPRVGVTATSGNGLLDDDPSGLRTGKVQPLKPPPPPLAAAQQASGQEVGQDVTTALAQDQQMDMYAVSLDKGNGIVAAGAGNIVAAGAGNYALLADLGATTTASATATPRPSPTPTPKADGTATAVATPRPARTPLPSLAPKFVPRLDALRAEATRAKLVAAAQLLNARLTQRAQKLPETKALKAAANAAQWTANLDGTFSKTFQAAVSKKLGGQPASGTLEVEATVDDASDTLVHHLARLDLSLAATTRTVTRELVVAADGSRHVSFHLEETDAKGRKRVVDLSKTLTLEGGLTGSGTATRYDADGRTLRSVSVTLSGTQDEPAAKAVDANSKLETSITLDPDGNAKAQVRDGATASTGEVKVDVDAAPQDEAATP